MDVAAEAVENLEMEAGCRGSRRRGGRRVKNSVDAHNYNYSEWSYLSNNQKEEVRYLRAQQG